MAQRHVGRGAFVLAGLALAGLSGVAPALAQELSAEGLRQVRAILAEKAARTPVEKKLDTSLLHARRESLGQAMVPGLPPLRRVASRAAVGRDGMVVVDIRGEVTDGLRRTIAGVGGRVISAYPAFGAVRARVPIRQVDVIAAVPEVRHVSPQQGFLLNTGSQTSQGDAAHAAASARAVYGISGAGVKVGVLSDGVDSLAARQATGDVPPTCPQAGACVEVVPGQAGSGDEGTAMLEIVHDLAPGATLYFATAVNGDASFAQNILDLRNTYGCDVIVDDVTYANEAAFQDGVIAQAVNTVTADGALYLSSAGNSGRQNAGTSGTWEGDFLDSGTTIDFFTGTDWEGLPIHSWNALTGGSAANSDPLAADAPNFITLKWSDPLGGATTDYDLFLMDSTLTNVFDYSTGDQTVPGQDPFEIMGNGYTDERVVVVRWSGSPKALRLDTNRGELTLATAGAVVGHNGGESAISVAATDGRLPGPGNLFVGGAANPVETYSSDGPRHMFFNPDGSEITPGNVLFGTGGGRELQKPDVTAADCVVTTSPGFNTFCGTSAAAPHTAAIAALLLSRSPRPTPDEVRARLAAPALDVGAGGADRDSGYGIAVALAADLSVSKAGPASVVRGTSVVYTITVANAGPDDAGSVQVADPTPPGLAFVSNTGDCTTVFPCSLGTLPSGEARAITATFSVPSGYSGPSPFTNTVTVSSNAADPAPANNSSSAETAVTSQADLSIGNTGPASVVRGTSVAYTIVVANTGPSDADSVQVADTTPTGLTFVSNTGDCTTAFPCSLGTLAAGATRTITATFSVPSGYSGASPVTNTATVSSATTDPTPANDSSSAETAVTSQADLSVVKTGPASVARGGSVVYTVTITNSGPSDADSVQVADPTPAGLTFDFNSGDCATAYPCALGTLAAGETRVIGTQYTVPSDYSGPSPFTNTATASSATTDPVPANNASSAQTTLRGVADLSITKAGPSFATRAADLTYTIVVTNDGPEAATSVEVADPTPTGLTFGSNTGDCATAFPCSLGTVPPGESRAITATFSVPAGYDVAVPIVNTASVSSAEGDPNPANDSDTVTSLFGAFYTLTPCRLVDTRKPGQAPALQPGEERSFVLAGPPCGIPVGAAALSVNLSVTSPTAPGNLRLYPADVEVPKVSNINFSAGQTRGNNAIVPATADGSVAIKVKNASSGTVQFILDVNGYFE
jgi:uncharacterized repeat protein (TIGR01451 family)